MVMHVVTLPSLAMKSRGELMRFPSRRCRFAIWLLMVSKPSSCKRPRRLNASRNRVYRLIRVIPAERA